MKRWSNVTNINEWKLGKEIKELGGEAVYKSLVQIITTLIHKHFTNESNQTSAFSPTPWVWGIHSEKAALFVTSFLPMWSSGNTCWREAKEMWSVWWDWDFQKMSRLQSLLPVWGTLRICFCENGIYLPTRWVNPGIRYLMKPLKCQRPDCTALS